MFFKETWSLVDLYSKEATTACVEGIQEIMGGKRHIFNLRSWNPS